MIYDDYDLDEFELTDRVEPVEVNTWDVPDAEPVRASVIELLEYLAAPDRQKKLRQMPYEAYLLTEHWRMTRREALQRTAYHCERCWQVRSPKRPLNVHHKTYERLGAEEQFDLEVLCRQCHEKEHGIEGQAS